MKHDPSIISQVIQMVKVRRAIVCHIIRVTTGRVAQWWQEFLTYNVISDSRLDTGVLSQYWREFEDMKKRMTGNM